MPNTWPIPSGSRPCHRGRFIFLGKSRFLAANAGCWRSENAFSRIREEPVLLLILEHLHKVRVGCYSVEFGNVFPAGEDEYEGRSAP